MLTSGLIHPQLLEALAGAGHGSKVLVADANYPVSTASAPAARRVYLNLCPGVVDASTVVQAVLGAVPVEAAHVMGPDDDRPVPIFDRFRDLLGPQGPALERLRRSDFYAAARGGDVAAVVATGEQALFANLLLTIGVVAPAVPR